MKVYVFGNIDLDYDNQALLLTSRRGLRPCSKNSAHCPDEIEFVEVKPNQDLPFSNNENVVLMDTIEGLSKVRLLRDDALDQLILSPRTSAHDFDLGFQLKYLKKLGRLGKVTIIGLPMQGKIDYKRIHSILRKLVAQDMQGS